MGKTKTVFVCQECGYDTNKWLGKCPSCGKWNTMVEETVVISDEKSGKGHIGIGALQNEKRGVSVPLSAVAGDDGGARESSGIGEVDRVLGGGFVKGSLTLIGGDPGIGKSTMILQVCGFLGASKNVLYVSGEESAAQIKLRADRLNIQAEKLRLMTENSIDIIEGAIEKEKPDFLVIDSIQTVYDDSMASAPGSVGQVREVTGKLLKIAKGLGITTIIIGHVTKEGTLAGPRVLEHMVDTVLYFEGERHMPYRILRGVKNRFGSTNEIGIFEMTEEGLTEVQNPSELMLLHGEKSIIGSAVVCGIEGSRPMLTEIQALVCKSAYGIPKRAVTGTDFNRVGMLVAVAEKLLLLPLWEQDIYINIAGGIKLSEPSCDLGIIAAIVSSMNNVPLPSNTAFCGEVGLTGEVRAVTHIDRRVTEAARTGFGRIFVPAGNYAKAKKAIAGHLENIEIVSTENVAVLYEKIAGKPERKR